MIILQRLRFSLNTATFLALLLGICNSYDQPSDRVAANRCQQQSENSGHTSETRGLPEVTSHAESLYTLGACADNHSNRLSGPVQAASRIGFLSPDVQCGPVESLGLGASEVRFELVPRPDTPLLAAADHNRQLVEGDLSKAMKPALKQQFMHYLRLVIFARMRSLYGNDGGHRGSLTWSNANRIKHSFARIKPLLSFRAKKVACKLSESRLFCCRGLGSLQTLSFRKHSESQPKLSDPFEENCPPDQASLAHRVRSPYDLVREQAEGAIVESTDLGTYRCDSDSNRTNSFSFSRTQSFSFSSVGSLWNSCDSIASTSSNSFDCAALERSILNRIEPEPSQARSLQKISPMRQNCRSSCSGFKTESLYGGFRRHSTFSTVSSSSLSDTDSNEVSSHHHVLPSNIDIITSYLAPNLTSIVLEEHRKRHCANSKEFSMPGSAPSQALFRANSVPTPFIPRSKDASSLNEPTSSSGLGKSLSSISADRLR